MPHKSALITGVTVEDGAYLAKLLLKIDPRYFRPTEVDLLIDDPTKVKDRIGWAHKTSFPDLAKEISRSIAG